MPNSTRERLVDPRPATLGDNGISVWTESGAEIRLKVPGEFYVVQDVRGRVWLDFGEFRLEVFQLHGVASGKPLGIYYLRITKSTTFLVHPMLRMASIKKALG